MYSKINFFEVHSYHNSLPLKVDVGGENMVALVFLNNLNLKTKMKFKKYWNALKVFDGNIWLKNE